MGGDAGGCGLVIRVQRACKTQHDIAVDKSRNIIEEWNIQAN